MRAAATVLTTLGLAASSVMVLAQPAQALGYGVECNVGRAQTQTNDWSVYWSRKVRASTRVCHRIGAWQIQNYPMFSYIRRPALSTVSRGPIPSAERVTLSDLRLYSVRRQHGDITRGTWRFHGKSCIGPVCNHHDFSYAVDVYGTRLCFVGGACDTWKQW